MSAAFTAPNSWVKGPRDLTGANEIVLAYSERRQALGQSAVGALSAGPTAQDRTLWLAMQNWLEANCTNFIDHVNGPLNPSGTDFLYFTLATWQAAAGLNVSAVDGESFRRKHNPADGTSYGHLASGDCRNNTWTFQDLQKGFGALNWTVRAGEEISDAADSRNAIRSSDQRDTCAHARASQMANWATGGTYGASIYIIIARLQEDDPANWFCGGFHSSGKSRISSVPTFCPHSADCYLRPQSGGESYEDVEGLFSGNGIYVLFESFAESSSDTHTTDYVGDYTVNPVELSTIAVCPVGSNGAGIVGVSHNWVVKWNFTNA